jgi:hypothetical protein
MIYLIKIYIINLTVFIKQQHSDHGGNGGEDAEGSNTTATTNSQ